MSATPDPSCPPPRPRRVEPRRPVGHEPPEGDLAAIRAVLRQTPDERLATLARAAAFFATAERG